MNADENLPGPELRWASMDELLDRYIAYMRKHNMTSADISVDLLCSTNISHVDMSMLLATAVQRLAGR